MIILLAARIEIYQSNSMVQFYFLQANLKIYVDHLYRLGTLLDLLDGISPFS